MLSTPRVYLSLDIVDLPGLQSAIGIYRHCSSASTHDETITGATHYMELVVSKDFLRDAS